MKVFIIEPDESCRREIGELINTLGYKSEDFGKADEFLLEKINRGNPDLILVNPIALENITKKLFDLLTPSLVEYPVVCIVDQQKTDVPEKFADFNICGWVTRPINLLAWRATIEIALAKHALARQETERFIQYRKILEHIQDVCWITDLDGIIEDVSPSVGDFFNFTRKELIGRPIVEFSGLATDNENIRSTLKKTGYLKDFKIEVRNKDNQLINCRLTAELIPGQKKVFGILKNIRGSQDTERQLSQILEGAAVPIFVINKQHVVTHWNKAIENLTGLPANQMIGLKSAWRAFYPEERPMLADLILDGANKNEFQKYYPQAVRESSLIPGSYESEGFFEKIGNRKNLWLFYTAAQIKNEKGRVIGVIETLHDISESVRIDRALKESELKFRTFFDQSSDGLILINQQGEVIEWNKTQEKITGIKRSYLIGRSMTDIVKMQPKTSWLKANLLDHFLEVVEYFLTNQETIIDKRVLEGEVQSKTGQRKYFQSTIFPIRLGDDTLVAIIVHDMTQYKQMESTRQNIEEQLRQQKRLESIGTLASGVAHEVNNPLTGIINYAQLIHDRVDDVTLQEFAHGIIEEGERVAGIVRNLLAFARQDKEGHSSARMSDIIRVSLALIETVIRKDMITIKVDVSDDLPMVKCKSQQIEQIIINLLMNARDALNMKYDDYNEEKIIEVRAYVNQPAGTRWLTTEVTDYGIGIPADIVNSIFDPFFTTKSRSEGTGLGLSVSYGIIKEHGGEIKVESVEGKYTKFMFSLPIDEITVS